MIIFLINHKEIVHMGAYQVLSLDGKTQVGKVCKEYSGFIREAFTNADNFSISCKLKQNLTWLNLK